MKKTIMCLFISSMMLAVPVLFADGSATETKEDLSCKCGPGCECALPCKCGTPASTEQKPVKNSETDKTQQ